MELSSLENMLSLGRHSAMDPTMAIRKMVDDKTLECSYPAFDVDTTDCTASFLETV